VRERAQRKARRRAGRATATATRSQRPSVLSARAEDLERSTRPDPCVGNADAQGGARPYSEEKPVDQAGMLKVPDGPGLGVTVNEAALKEARMPGEPWWD